MNEDENDPLEGLGGGSPLEDLGAANPMEGMDAASPMEGLDAGGMADMGPGPAFGDDAGLPPGAPDGGAMIDPMAGAGAGAAAGAGAVVDRRKKAVLSVPIEVVVAVGRARPMLADLVKLNRDSLLTLNSKIEDPVEILIGEKVIARGELQELDGESGRLGVRLTEVADLSQSL